MAIDFEKLRSGNYRGENKTGSSYSGINFEAIRSGNYLSNSEYETKRKKALEEAKKNRTSTSGRQQEVSQKNNIVEAQRTQTIENLKNAALSDKDFKKYSIAGLQESVINNSKNTASEKGYRIYKAPNQKRDDSYLRKMMSDEESDIYNYYLGKFGREKAEEYYDAIAEDINKRYAELITTKNEDEVLNQLIYGAAAGLENFKEGTKRGLKMLAGNGEVQPTTAYEYGSQMTRENLGDTGPDLGGVSLGQVGYDLVTNTANMLPSMAIGLVTAGLGGSAAMGLSAAGNTYQQDLKDGYTEEEAWKHGALVGAAEGALQYIFGGIGALGGKFTTKAIGRFMPKLKSALARVAVKVPASMASEGFEEYSQEILDTVFRNWIFDENNDIDLLSEEAIYSGILGALTAGFIEGPSVAVNESIKADYDQRFEGVKAGLREETASAETQYTDDEISEMAENIMKVMGGTATEENIMEFAGSRDEKAVAERIMSTGRATSNFTIRKDAKNYLVEQGVGLKERLTTSGKKQIEKANKMLDEERQTQNRDMVLKNGFTEEQVQNMSTEEVAQAAAEIKKAEKMSTETQMITELSKDESEGYQKVISEAYKDYAQTDEPFKMDAEDFANEFSSFYDIGRAGVESVDRALEAYGKGNPQFTNALARAYELGRGEAIVANKASVESKQAEIDAKLQAAKGKTVTSVGQVRLATEAELKNPKVAAVGGKVVTKGKKLSKQHRATMQFVREFAKLSGINVVLYEGGKSRGWYDSVNNEIYLNIEEGMNLKTLSHELTHFIQERSPKQYEEFKQFLLDYYKANGKYQQLLQQAHKVQRDLAAEELEDEIVANACQMFISDTDAMQKLIDTQSKGLIDTITRWFNNMCDYLRQAFESVHASHAAAQALEEDIEMLEKARDKWYELLNESIAVNKKINGAQLTTGQVKKADSKAKFELKDDEYMAAVNNGDMETAQKLVDEAAKAAGYNIHAFHGTSRGDRVGNVFLPERATSGPMAFFTDDKATAEGYATGKRDTSIAYDPDFDSYETQFRVKVSGMDIPFHRAWGYLPFDARNRVAKKAGQLREDWDGDNELILDPETNEANGGFQWQLKEARGNVIKALIDQWLNSGNLFNEEAKFLDVIEMSGLKEEFAKVGINTIYFKDPNARYEKVYDVYLKMNRPFDTAKVNKRFVTNLLKWYDKQDERKYQRENMESDLWDKNGIDAYEFAERLERDIENNTTHAWTSIPDSVTDYLKHLKYDGIKDLGGKFHETTHTVWIPFYSEQIKTTEPVTYDNKGKVIPLSERFNDYDRDIRFEMKDSEGNELSPEQAEFFKNSKMRDENGALKVMHHGTNEAGFTVFDPSYSDDAISLFFTDNTDVAGSYSSLPDDSRYDPYNENTDIKTAADFGNLYQQTYTEKKSGENIFKIRVEKVGPELTKHFKNKLEADGLQLVHSAERFLKEAEKFYSMPYENYENEDLIEEGFKTLREARAHNLEYGTIEEIGRALPDIMDAISTLSVVAQHYFNYHVLLENPSNMADLSKQVTGLEEREKMAWQIRGGYQASEDMLEMFKHNKGKWVWFTEASNRGLRNGTKAIGIDPDDDATMFGTEEEVVKRAVKFGADTGMINVGGNRYDVYLNLENPYIYEGEEKFKGTLWSLEIVEDIYDEYDVYVMFDRNARKKHVDHFFDQYEVEQFIKQSVTDKNVKAELLREITGDFANVPVDLVINDYWNNLKGPDGSKWNTRKYTQYAKDNGYDGIIFKGIYDNGGQSHYEEADVPSTIAVAFSSEQVKDVDNKAPTKDPDIRFELKDDIDNLVLANYNSIRLPAEEYARLSHAVGTYQPQTRGFTTQILDNPNGYPAFEYVVYVRNDGRLVVIYKNITKTKPKKERSIYYDKETRTPDSILEEYRNLARYDYNDRGRTERGSDRRNDGISDSETRIGDGSNERGSHKSVAYLSEEEWQNFLDDWLDRSDFKYELKDEDENRLEILGNQEERLVNDLKTIEKYYGDAIRQVYEQNIKPNEGISKRAEELNRKAARRFMNEVGAMFQVPKDTREKYLLPIINEMIDKGPAISDREGLIERLYQTAYEHTEDYIVDTDPEGNYKNLRGYIRKTSIFVNAGTKADVGDYNNFRKRNMGSLRLTSDQTALGLDEFYDEVSNLAPEIFSGTTDGAEQLYELSSFMKDRGRTESIGDYMPQAEYTAWADETLEPELNKLFDSTVGSFLSEASRKERERQRAAKVDRAMENVSGAIRNYEAAQDYARAEGVLAGQIEQGKKDAAEMRRMQESFERKAKNYEDMLEAKRAKIAEIRQRRDEILAEQKAAFKEYREQRNEAIRSGGTRKSIEKNAKTLMDWLLKNSDKEHVPEALKTTVGEFLETIDFTSKRGLAGGESTKKDQAFAQKLNNLAAMLEKQRNYMNSANEGDAENPLDCFLDLPEGFAEEIRKLADDVAETAIGGNFVINDMNSEQLAQLNKALRVLKTSISKMNKLITNAHFASVTEAARNSMLEMAEYKAHKPMNDISEQADKMLKWEMFTPVYAFKRYGSAGESIFKGIQKGWSDFAFAIDKVLKFAEKTYTDKEVEAWEKETHSIKLSDGKTVTLTTTQLMSLYCLNKREQARGHIYGGGIRIADIKEGKAKIQQTEPYLVSFEDVETLISELSDRQIDVADKLQKFMTEQGSEWGNKVSMERFGYRAFTEENYFPIESDANNLIAIDPEAKANDMFRLLNMSATKSLTKGANNAIVISDIFDIFSNHMSDMAKYGTLALPILDTMKWYNYKVRYDVGDGQFRTETVQKSVERAYGKAGKSYFTNFMKDLNGVKEGGRGIGLVNKMVSNYKIASVGANLRVAVLQPTSIVRASMEIEPKYLLQALTKAPAAKEAEKKSGIALWKSLGFYNTDIARGIRDQIKGGGKTIDKVRDKTMILAEKMDRITFGTLWNAAKAKAKDLGYSGEELDVKTTEIFDNIIYKTQVVDSTLTRSSLMRSTNEAVKSITAFMAEPTLSYNMVAETVYDMAKERDFSTGWQKNSERFGKAVAIYAASSIAAAVIESIPDAFRDDDDEEWFGQKWWQAFWGERFWDGNLLSEINVLEKIPLLKDFISVRKGYDIQRLDAAWMSSLNKAIDINTELYNVYVKGEKPTKTTYWGKMTAYGAAYANLRAISQIAGLPVSNTVRDVVAIWNTIVGGMAPSLKVKTYDDSKKK